MHRADPAQPRPVVGRLNGATRVRVQPTVVEVIGDEGADVRVHPTGLSDKDTTVRADGGVAIEDVLEDELLLRAPNFARSPIGAQVFLNFTFEERPFFFATRVSVEAGGGPAETDHPNGAKLVSPTPPKSAGSGSN